MDTTTPFVGEWGIFNSIIVTIAGAAVLGISVILLLVCLGAKRRLMSVRSNFVPVLSQAAISQKQKKFIIDEQSLETAFEMTPKPDIAPHGWFDEQINIMGNGKKKKKAFISPCN